MQARQKAFRDKETQEQENNVPTRRSSMTKSKCSNFRMKHPAKNYSENILSIGRMQLRETASLFKDLFDENKHLMNLECDNCSGKFETLEEARRHYPAEHNIAKGYIKCCNAKMTYQCEVVRHLLSRHVQAKRFK